MRRKPLETITGYQWLDTLTAPAWCAWCSLVKWYSEWVIGGGDRVEGRRRIRMALLEARFRRLDQERL